MEISNIQVRYNALSNFEYERIEEERFELYTLENDDLRESFATDVSAGLSSPQKYLLPKYFYDAEGSMLFDKITTTSEYYPKRIEKRLLHSISDTLLNKLKSPEALIELGSGTSEKTHALLGALHSSQETLRYVPVDVSDIIIESSRSLLETYNNLKITGIIADYTSGLTVLPMLEEREKLLVFLGSSIGNLNRVERNILLGQIHDALDPGDSVLIGFDLVKDINVLNAAYNDKSGVTREFNLNLLRRINRELGGEFNVANFEHYAFFNEKSSRIEMHLISRVEQNVYIESLDQEFSFAAGESIHTENSYKFSDQMIQQLVTTSGFSHIRTWKDPDAFFALTLIRSH